MASEGGKTSDFRSKKEELFDMEKVKRSGQMLVRLATASDLDRVAHFYDDLGRVDWLTDQPIWSDLRQKITDQQLWLGFFNEELGFAVALEERQAGFHQEMSLLATKLIFQGRNLTTAFLALVLSLQPVKIVSTLARATNLGHVGLLERSGFRATDRHQDDIFVYRKNITCH